MTQPSIDERQRDDVSARLLRAFTAEYRRAKLYRGVRLGVSCVLALAGPLVGVASLTAAGVVGAIAGLWVVITRLLLIPVEKDHVGRAVRIQELFDTRLFDLEWPDGLAGLMPNQEDISDAARRVVGNARVAKQIDEGWYPSTKDIPWPVNVLLAQWSSVGYGRHQNTAYFRFLATSTGVAAVAVIIFGIATGMTLTDWLITFALPSLPALLDISEVADAHRRLAADKATLEGDLLQPMWRKELVHRGTLTLGDCGRVQDESFRMRELGLQVPDWFFRLRRARGEQNMHEACAARRAEYLGASA